MLRLYSLVALPKDESAETSSLTAECGEECHVSLADALGLIWEV